MALNWAMLDGVRAPVPLPHEMTITSVESGVELALTVPGGTDGSARKLKETGKIWVTDQRVRIPLNQHKRVLIVRAGHLRRA
jgi:hypothetical protein